MSEEFENRDQIESNLPEFPWKFFLPAIIIAGCTSIIGVVVSIIGKYCWTGKPWPLQKGKVDTIGTESTGWMKDVEANTSGSDSAQPKSNNINCENSNEEVCSITGVDASDSNNVVHAEEKCGSASDNEGVKL